MSNQEINKTQGKRANTMHSLKMKIFLLVFIAIIFAISLCLLMIVPKSKSNLETVIENYMKDITVVEGENLDRELANEGADTVLSAEALQDDLKGISIRGCHQATLIFFLGQTEPCCIIRQQTRSAFW